MLFGIHWPKTGWFGLVRDPVLLGRSPLTLETQLSYKLGLHLR